MGDYIKKGESFCTSLVCIHPISFRSMVTWFSLWVYSSTMKWRNSIRHWIYFLTVLCLATFFSPLFETALAVHNWITRQTDLFCVDWALAVSNTSSFLSCYDAYSYGISYWKANKRNITMCEAYVLKRLYMAAIYQMIGFMDKYCMAGTSLF